MSEKDVSLNDIETGELAYLRVECDRLRHQLTVAQLGESDAVKKHRERFSAVERELKLAQHGLTSGCGCPIGQCVRKLGDTGSCWMQWAEAHVLKRMAGQRIDELLRHGNHPGRLVAARQESKPSRQTTECKHTRIHHEYLCDVDVTVSRCLDCGAEV